MESNKPLQQAEECARQGDTIGAIAWLTKAIAEDDTQAEAYRERGRLLLALGDKAGAEADLRRFAELSPEALDGVNGSFTTEARERPKKRSLLQLKR